MTELRWAENARWRPQAGLFSDYGLEAAERVRRFHRTLPGYAPTPLVRMDALAAALGLNEIQEGPHGLRVGLLARDYAVADFARLVEERLNTRARWYSAGEKTIRRVAVLGGAGGDFFEEALACGADAFVTGEVRHHEALAACGQGLCVVEGGHYETEQIAIKLLINRLQARCDALQYNVTVIESRLSPYMRQII